ncbi:MAG: hypothetical protein N4A33_05815 [Bacteriovoracaceae bacterium]|jgi:glycolate oxidase|nr:hypothetical protein [Bacteriovoracaceae bacterium]
MALNKKVFKDIDELKKHIKTHKASFYYSSQTSTVIPYDYLEQIFTKDDFYLCDLSLMRKSMKIEDDHLIIEGAVSWKEAKEFCQSSGYCIKTSPTEELALISAGAATSATGERYFCHGNLRSQISEITYLDYNADIKTLKKEKPFSFNIGDYSEDMKKYTSFKNPPFPMFENETDLLIGTEGQLGVITGLKLKIDKDTNSIFMFMLLDKWEQNDDAHLEVIEKVQNFRTHTHICEYIDSNAFSYLDSKDRPNKGKDAIFFEIKESMFEDFYENFICKLEHIKQEEIFEVSKQKFHLIRAGVPRAVFEENSKMGVKKMGTDVQVKIKDFPKLLNIYREFTQEGVKYNLFGHFGDAHLHFNFMPIDSQTSLCQRKLEKMYKEVANIEASPFAEHGIGVIKQKFIKDFWTDSQYEVFKMLKETCDPHNQFFPQGFMCIQK